MHRTRLVPATLLACVLLLPLGISSAVSSDTMPAAADRADVRQLIEPDKPFGREPAALHEHTASAVDLAGIGAGYVFVPINPYRTFDSRDYADGYLLGGDVMWFDVITDRHGIQQIPADAVAVTYNLAIVDTSGSGFLGIYPADITWPGNASINWTVPGTTLSNGGTVAVGWYTGPGEIEIYCGPAIWTTGTDFVLDITGYYV